METSHENASARMKAAINKAKRLQPHWEDFTKDDGPWPQSWNNLKMHLTSRIHRPAQIMCPFCKRSLQSATGLSHHLERGSCPKAAGLHRETIYKFIRSKDPNGAITNNLIGWHGSTVHYEASDLAFNHRCGAWECYLCHRLFGSLAGLNQHLNSPVHQKSSIIVQR
ncbi:zinc finger protein [Fusarium longipes]|uniref:Zinc finger protein n=1 Tax=Fusarium longipes TaxID=694270 RepID=A0A395SAY2_9HYPO|nr:zinc finger protein [Fusarium longipes]